MHDQVSRLVGLDRFRVNAVVDDGDQLDLEVELVARAAACRHCGRGAPDIKELPDVIGGQEGDYILQLQSESMGSAGFLGGDYVVVRPTHDPDSGAIVVVTAGEKVTLMRVCRDGDQLRLRSEGEQGKGLPTSEVSILGRVVGLIRRVETKGPTKTNAATRRADDANGPPDHQEEQAPNGSKIRCSVSASRRTLLRALPW